MRKFWTAVATLLLGLAGAMGGAGLYSGWPEVVGIHFLADESWRASVGLVPGEDGNLAPSVALSLDLVLASGQVWVGDGAAMPDLDYYAGAGVTGSLLKPDPELNGHAMLGLEAYFTAMKSVGFFGELQLGQRFGFFPFSTRPFLGFRVGLSLR